MNRYERHELDDNDSVHFRWRENTDCGVWEGIKYGLFLEAQESIGKMQYLSNGSTY